MEVKRKKVDLNKGDTCWILENNSYAVSGTVKNIGGGFYTILLSNGSAVRLKPHPGICDKRRGRSSINKEPGKCCSPVPL